MVYRRSKVNIRRPRRRASIRRRPSYSRPVRRRTSRRAAAHKCPPPPLTPGTKFALAQLDPFDERVQGAKIPDSNTIPSIATTDVENVSITVDAGVNAVAFRPQYTFGTVAATGAAATVSWGLSYNALGVNRGKRSNFISACELVRPVAHAIRLSSPVAPTSASGFVHIGISTESSFGVATWQFPTSVADMTGLQHYRRVTLASLTQTPLTVINKWLDDTGFRYSSPSAQIENSTSGMFQTDYAWGVIVVMLENCPLGAPLSAEHLLMTEAVPDKRGVIIGTVAAPNSPATLSAVGHMATQQSPFHTEAEQEGYIQQGISAIAEGAADMGANAFQTIGVPLLRQVGGRAVGVASNIMLNSLLGVAGIAGVNNNANRLSIGS